MEAGSILYKPLALRLQATIRNVRYQFGSVNEVLAKANPPKSGDDQCQISARDAVERVAARAALSRLTLADLRASPVLPYQSVDFSPMDFQIHCIQRLHTWETLADLGDFQHSLSGPSEAPDGQRPPPELR